VDDVDLETLRHPFEHIDVGVIRRPQTEFVVPHPGHAPQSKALSHIQGMHYSCRLSASVDGLGSGLNQLSGDPVCPDARPGRRAVLGKDVDAGIDEIRVLQHVEARFSSGIPQG
jgi:hypothetical protein